MDTNILLQKYKNITDEDLKRVISFLSDPEIVKQKENIQIRETEIKTTSKKGKNFLMVAYLCFLVIVVLYTFFGKKLFPLAFKTNYLLIVIPLAVVVLATFFLRYEISSFITGIIHSPFFYIQYIIGKIEGSYEEIVEDLGNENENIKQAKEKIIQSFLKCITSDLIYSNTLQLENYLKDCYEIQKRTGLLNTFDKVKKIGNFLQYKQNINGEEVIIEGVEIITEKNVWDKRVVNNHVFMTHISFPFSLGVKKPLKLTTDVRNSTKRKIRKTLLVTSEIFIVGTFFSRTLLIEGNGNYFQKRGVHPLIFSVVCFFVLFSIISIVFNEMRKKSGKKKGISIENNAFERKFDAYCEDPLDARTFLTPNRIDCLVGFTETVNSERKYELWVYNTEIFIKFDMIDSKEKKTFEIDYTEEESIESFIALYSEIKLLLTTVEKLHLTYM